MTTIEILTFFGRILFGAYFIYSGYNHFKNQKGYIGYAKHKGVPSPNLAVPLTGVLLVLGGLGFFLNVQVVQSAFILLIFMIPTTLIMHAYWKEKDPASRATEHAAFMKNLALIGALLTFLG
ncbi:DoxX family protein [Candidatus Nomurabacteria bacterium]|nr:DoxX family protein [Candidatus Nomurabacteria bacterium]